MAISRKAQVPKGLPLKQHQSPGLIPAVFSAVFLLFPSRLHAVATTIGGVVAVLDPRLGKARYRWDIVKALPLQERIPKTSVYTHVAGHSERRHERLQRNATEEAVTASCPGRGAFLAKPFRPSDFNRAVAELL